MRRPAMMLFAAGLLTAIILATVGCEDPVEPPDCTGSSRLQGQVVTGGPLEDAMIQIRKLADENGDRASFELHPDETGRYGVDLPAGDYTLSFHPTSSYSPRYDYTAAGLVPWSIDADTVRIDPSVSPVNIDFIVGPLELTVGLSPLLDGEKCRLYVTLYNEEETDNSTRYLKETSTVIMDGRAQFDLAGFSPKIPVRDRLRNR